MARTKTTSAPGTRGATPRRTPSSARNPIPSANVGTWVSGSLPASSASSGKKSCSWSFSPKSLLELRRDENQRGPGHVADEHRLGEEIGDHREAQPRGDQHDRAADERRRGGQHGDTRRIAARERPDRARDEQRDGCVRPGDDLPRAGEDRVSEHRGECRVEPVGRGKTGEISVGDDGRNHHDAGADAANDVAAKRFAAALAEEPNDRQHVLPAGCAGRLCLPRACHAPISASAGTVQPGQLCGITTIMSRSLPLAVLNCIGWDSRT